MTQRIQAVLADLEDENDEEVEPIASLQALAQEHAILTETLQQAGFSNNPGLLPLAEKVREEVRAVVSRLEFCRNCTLEALVSHVRGRKCVETYGKEANRPHWDLQGRI